jgi:hypothetical protein
MNEIGFCSAGAAGFIGRLCSCSATQDATKADIPVYRGAGRSGATALASSLAALMLSGCPTTGGGEGGGPSSLAAVQGARSAQNVVAHEQAIAQQQAQQQAQRQAALEARREARIEAARSVQAASDRLALKQEQEKVQRQAQEQRQRQQAQQQVNQGRGPQGNQGQGPQGNQGRGVGQGGTPPGQSR